MIDIFTLFSEVGTEHPIPEIPPITDVPNPNPTTDLGYIFLWIYHCMHDICSITYAGFTFNLWDVSIIVIIFSLLGWMLGKFINPWGHDHDD